MMPFLRLWIVGGVMVPFAVYAITTTRITATVVASSCLGKISAQGLRSNTNVIDFGVINPKASTRSIPTHNFSLTLSEYEGGDVGCSAFQAYGQDHQYATITFGDLNNAQLDAQGVVTRYVDGDPSTVRVLVSPIDPEARFDKSEAPGFMTSTHNTLTYPVDFAAKGKFDFSARLANTENAKPGKFTGTLTLTIEYR